MIKFAGGKGINVSRVLKRLDIPNTAVSSEALLENLSRMRQLKNKLERNLSKWQKDTYQCQDKQRSKKRNQWDWSNVEPEQLEELKAILQV